MSDRNQPNTDYAPEPGTLVIEDQSIRHGFVQLPRQVLLAKNLSRDAKLLYAVILHYAWQEGRCFPGYGRLCADMGASENMVRKYMRELEALGLLRQKRRGQGLTNLYTLPDLRTSKIEVQEPHESRTSKTEVQEPQQSEVPEPAKTEVYIETEEIETEELEFEHSNIRKRSKDLDARDDDGSIESNALHAAEQRRRANETGSEVPSLGDVVGARFGGRGRPPLDFSEDRQAILAFIQDFAREMGDSAPLQSSTTRALNLYRDAGLPREAFIETLYQARAITQERSASITSQTTGEGAFPRKRKMAYFFSVLEDRLGLKDTKLKRT